MTMKQKTALALVVAAFALSACATTGSASTGNDFSDYLTGKGYDNAQLTGTAVGCGGNQKANAGAFTYKAIRGGQAVTGVICAQDGTYKISPSVN